MFDITQLPARTGRARPAPKPSFDQTHALSCGCDTESGSMLPGCRIVIARPEAEAIQGQVQVQSKSNCVKG